jgi:hypothetical protein
MVDQKTGEGRYVITYEGKWRNCNKKKMKVKFHGRKAKKEE